MPTNQYHRGLLHRKGIKTSSCTRNITNDVLLEQIKIRNQILLTQYIASLLNCKKLKEVNEYYSNE